MSRRRIYEDDGADDRGSSRKKRRMSSNEPMEIEERLESLIMRVGEKSTSSLESNLEGLAGVLEADLPNYKYKILRILCDCAVKMPEKTTVYSTLVGLLNARNYNCGGEFVETMVRNFKEALKVCEFENARVMMRFLADLVNCHVIAAGSLINLFDSLIEVTLEDNAPQVRYDWYVFAVLSCLPWVGRELYEKKEQDLDRLLTTIDAYITKRQKPHVTALRVWSSDEPHPQEEYLDSLWAQVRKLRNDNWQERHILRPYLAFDGTLCEALQHNIPQIIPPPHHEECFYPYPWVVFRLFDYTDCPEVGQAQGGPLLPGAHSIERFLIEEQLRRIVQGQSGERKDCAAQLLNFPAKSKVPLDYMIVEVIFSELFHMPIPKNIEIYYGSLLIELCKLQPSTMPQVLAQATELLYDRLDTMNTSCFDRFVCWFSYHLSNFQFCWSWEDWSSCLALDLEHPKSKFVREVLLKCMRLSYQQRIKDFMPASFEALLPALPDPVYKYEAEGAGSLPGTTVANQLVASIRNKCTPEEVLMILKELPNPLQEEDSEPTHNPLKIDVFVLTILNMGAKTISHSFAAIAKFHYVFKMLAPGEEAQICVLRTMFELWSTHQQMMVILVDKMLKTQIVECFAVANWLFSKEMAQEFTKIYVWEILNLTIRKMDTHVQKLQKEIEEAKEKLNKTDEDMTGDKVDDKDKPTEEVIERMDERLEAAQADQKNLFLIIFQRFIMILTEHIVKRESESQDYNTFWYKWTIGRLQQVFLMHHEQVFKYISTLETLLFTSDIDSHILDIFQQFSALRA